MSLIGDLLQAGGAYAGNVAQAEATDAASRRQFELGQQAFNLSKAGVVDPTGSVIGRVDPDTGAPTTTLSPSMQQILNRNIANTQLAGTQGEERLGIVSERLGNLPSERPSRESITNQVRDDARRLQESIITPAINTASIADIRSGRPHTSNALSRSSNIGKVTRDLGNTLNFQQGKEIENRLNVGRTNADLDALRLNPNITGVGIPGAPSSDKQVGAGFQLAAMTPLDSGAGNLGNTFAQFGALQNANERDKMFSDAIARGLKNQINVPGMTGTTP